MPDLAAPAPEAAARLRLYELLIERMGPDLVHLGQLHDDTAHSSVVVMGVRADQSAHGMRGGDGPSSRMTFEVEVVIEHADVGADVLEITAEAWSLVGQVRQHVRDSIRDRWSWGDGIHHPDPSGTESIGPVAMARGGYLETILLRIAFTATI